MFSLPASQNKRRALVRTAMVVLALAYVALIMAARTWAIEVHGLTVAVLVVFCVFAAFEFSVFDEVAKQAHYVAWYWGGFVGLCALALLHISLSFDAAPAVAIHNGVIERLGGGGPHQAFLAGTVVTPLLMVAGFVIFRTIDWLRSR